MANLTPEEIKRLVDEADRLCENEEYEAALKLDLQAAEAGDARARTHMGWYYENGCGTDYDPSEAIRWYKLAAEQDFAPAQFCLGQCYEEGVGTAPDSDKAVEYYRLAAAKGLEDAIDALKRLGLSISTESAAPKYTPQQLERIAEEARTLYVQGNYDDAIAKAALAAPEGNPTAQYVLGMSLLSTGESIAEAERWLRKAADNNHLPAILDLARLLKEGSRLDKDLRGAAQLYEKAIKAGSPAAYFLLGQCYEFGEGVDNDIDIAVSLYREGADRKDAAALFALGQCYMTGSGVEEDYDAAELNLRAAAAAGYAEAREALETLAALRSPAPAREVGEEMEQKLARAEALIADKKYDEARPLIEECAEVGMPRAQALLGDFYYKARGGCPRDTQKALEWYKRGADGGDTDAMMGAASILDAEEKDEEASVYYEQAAVAGNIQAAYNLGRMYELGHGIEKDIKRAFAWYLTAAEGGDVLSQRLVATMFEKGNGTDADREAARSWYAKASKNGDFAARKALQRLNDEDREAGKAPKEETDRKPSVTLGADEVANLIKRREELLAAGKREDIFDIDQKLTDAGIARGIGNLGFDYLHGYGAPSNPEKALELLQKAVGMGDPYAMLTLGTMYETGKGVKQDVAEAERLFRRALAGGCEAAREALDRLCGGSKAGVTEQKPAMTIEEQAEEASRLYEEGEYAKAFEKARIPADAGNPKAAEVVALCYDFGRGTSADTTQAVRYYQIAARAELPLSCLNLGVAYEFGNGVLAVDKHRATELYRMAANQGNSTAQCNLAYCYEQGIGLVKDAALAAQWYTRSAEQNNPRAQANLGFCYESGLGVAKDVKKAIDLYFKSVKNNYPYGQMRLANCYENGIGVNINIDEAVRLYKMAAQGGNEYARKRLEYIENANRRGINNELLALSSRADAQYKAKNYEEAIRLAQKPADAGEARAAEILGLCYEFGFGTKTDMTKAVRYYKIAAEGGKPVAQLNLGVAYEFGKGVAQDKKRAFELYLAAARQGDRAAQCNVGYCYEQGIGVARDYAQAVEWYRRSAEQGHPRALGCLGKCYEEGWGVTRDMKLAIEYLRKGADAGNAYSQCELAIIYETGKGVPANIELARQWYKKAAAQGNKYAIERLKKI